MLRSLLYVCALCAAAAFALASCARAPHTADDALRLYVSAGQTSLNPLLGSTQNAQDLALLAYDTLLAPDANDRLRPDLAKVVPSRANGGISRDGKTVVFELRHDVRWHDGRPFTSADVAFTFAEIDDPKVDVASRTGFDRIARVTTPDRYTVVVKLKAPFAPFVSYAGYEYAIVPKHLLEGTKNFNHDPIGSHPVGTGPYKFKSWQRGNRIEYVANEAYFGGAPKIKALSIAELPDQNTVALRFRTHELDMGTVTFGSYAALRSLPELRTDLEPSNNFFAYALNTTRPILRDVRVRRAISLAIDRASLVRKNTLGTATVAYADLPALMWSPREPPNPYAYDVAAASALLEKAGWVMGASGIRMKDGAPLRLRGVSGRSKTSQGVDLVVQQMLRRVGIAWSTRYYDPALYFESKANGGPLAIGDYDTATYGIVGGIDVENDQLYTCANREPKGFNAAFYCSTEMDALQRDSLATADPVRRAADVAKIEMLAAREVPYVFIYHTPFKFVWNERLRRTHANVSDQWYDIADWTLSR